MDLEADDLVYFSELIESEGLESSWKAFSDNLRPLTDEVRQEQRKAIEELLFFSDRGTPILAPMKFEILYTKDIF